MAPTAVESANPLEDDIDEDFPDEDLSDEDLPDEDLPDENLPDGPQDITSMNSSALRDTHNNGLEHGDSEPEDQDADVDSIGSQVDSDASSSDDNFEGDSEEDLELYDTYHSD